MSVKGTNSWDSPTMIIAVRFCLTSHKINEEEKEEQKQFLLRQSNYHDCLQN